MRSTRELERLVQLADSLLWETGANWRACLAEGSELLEKRPGKETYEVPGIGEVDFYLEQGALERVECDLEVFQNVEDLDELEYEDKVDEFFDLFESYTERFEQVLGKPEFSDGAAARGYPEDQDAEWVSLWRRPLSRQMLQQRHEDRELPFRVCFVATAPVR